MACERKDRRLGATEHDLIGWWARAYQSADAVMKTCPRDVYGTDGFCARRIGSFDRQHVCQRLCGCSHSPSVSQSVTI